MPGIERLPLWLRTVIYWAVFSLTMWVAITLAAGGSLQVSNLMLVAALFGLGTLIEACISSRRLKD